MGLVLGVQDFVTILDVVMVDEHVYWLVVAMDDLQPFVVADD